LVGRDTLGDVVVAEVARCGVDVAVARSAAVATSAVIVLVDGHGERSFFYRPGGNERLAVDAIPPDLLREARFLHVGGAMKLWALDLAALLTRAKTSGCTTSLDTDWDTSGKWFATLQPVLSQVDYLLTNEEEGRALTGLDTPAEIAMRLLATGPRAVVVKRGPRGALAATNGMVQEFPPCDVPVHDTTCAGDAFAAGFLYGLTQQWPVAAAVRFANAAGALATTQISHQGITSLAAVRELLDRSGEDRSGETL
jgi:sugar/nucleoside kinase (ribokinase family)